MTFLNGCSQTLEALFECQYILGIMCWKFKFLIILSYSEDAQHTATGTFYWRFFFVFFGDTDLAMNCLSGYSDQPYT